MAEIKTLKIIQHNVRNWETHKHNLFNTYKEIDPEIILINSHGCPSTKKIKIFNYTTYQSNKTGQLNDGVAIAVKKELKHLIDEEFMEETMAVKIQTTQGPVIIATTYLPPRRDYLPAQDLLKTANSILPAYILGDFNARHQLLGHAGRNNVGDGIATAINTGKLVHLGPHFPTFLGHHSLTTPDRVFCHNKAFFINHIQQGPLTASDHLPIIFTISTCPIQIPVPLRYSMGKANWEGYREELRNYDIPDLQGKNTADIENEIHRLQGVIQTAVKNNIPQTQYKTLPHNKTTDKLRLLQTQYNNIMQFTQRFQPTVALMRNIRDIQRELQEESFKTTQ